MRQKSWALPLLILGCTAQAAEHFDGKTWWDTVKVISDDKFEGRDTGSRGERQAQEYTVAEPKALGVEPADLAAAAGYEEVIRALTIAVANDPQRPQWKPDSFFRRYAGG
jgi:hypothetical protein